MQYIAVLQYRGVARIRFHAFTIPFIRGYKGKPGVMSVHSGSVPRVGETGIRRTCACQAAGGIRG